MSGDRYRQEIRGGSANPVWVWGDGVPIDHKTLDQAHALASMPQVRGPVRLMPDAHYGRGSTVGSVFATENVIIPASVGVDIGCGMMATRLEGVTASDLPDDLGPVRAEVEEAVPVGFSQHEESVGKSLLDPIGAGTDAMLRFLDERHPKLARRRRAPMAEVIGRQLGTLGGGNHFIELCLDEEDRAWVMLHSGSRGIGNVIGTYFTELALEDVTRAGLSVPDKDLAYLREGTEWFDDYVFAVEWCQEYARANRELMMRLVLVSLVGHLPPFRRGDVAVNCHHNYVARERWDGRDLFVTRKGAVRAGEGEMGIIPGSMGARSYIVRGLGSARSLASCSHGAGRVMSRGQAKREITLEAHAAAVEGIECRRDEGVLDESPAAYKDIDAVMAAQDDLVEVVHRLRQVMCVKG